MEYLLNIPALSAGKRMEVYEKMSMTPRERLLCVLHGGIPDRVPVSPFVQETYLSYFLHKTETDRLLDGKACADALDFDLMARINRYDTPAAMLHSAPNWAVTIRTEVENGVFKRYQTIVTPTRTLTQVEAAPYEPDKLGGTHFSTAKYLIEDADDFAAFRRYMPPMDAAYREEFLAYSAFAKQAIGSRGVTVPWSISSVYNLVSRYINVQDMMVDALADPDYYDAYMRLFTQLCVEHCDLFTKSDFDCMGIQGNIANGALMGEQFFTNCVMPYEQRVLDVAKAADLPTVYHNCGRAKNLYPCYKKMGISVWETVAMPRQGDNDLATAKAFFGDSLILCGTLDQVDFLKTATPEEVRRRTEETVSIGKPGGHYIFAASDYLETDTPKINVQAMIEAAKQAGRYAL